MSIKDVRKEGEGVWSKMRTEGGVKDPADIRKLVLLILTVCFVDALYV